MKWLWTAGGAFCLAAALLIAARRNSLPRSEAFLEAQDRHPVWKWMPAAILGVGMPAAACAYRTAHFYCYRIMLDAGVMGNAAWNLAHGYGWISSLIGDRNCLAIHFAFTLALLSPLLWLWPHVLVLVLAQTAALGSTAMGMYLLGRLHCRRHWAAWCLALLAWSHPFLLDSMTEMIDNTPFSLPFFVWGAYCWESGRRRAAALFAFLLLTTREQAPFLFFGLGLLVLARAQDRRRRAIGACLAALSLALWLGEMKIVESLHGGWSRHVDFWQAYYPDLGGAGLWSTALNRPQAFVRALIVPYEKLWVCLRTFLSLALLPLWAGNYLLPAAAVWLPQDLSTRPIFYALKGHYAAFVAGPLFWGAVHGLRRLLQRMSPAAQRLAAAWILTVCAFCFFCAPGFLPAPDSWESLLANAFHDSAPKAFKKVPPQAKVWCDEFLVPHLAMRRYIKDLPMSSANFYFADRLFLPDRVILSRRWMTASEGATRDRVLKFLAMRKFVMIFRDEHLAVLANPSPAAGGAAVEWVSLPEAS